METYKMLVTLKQDRELCIIFPRSWQQHVYCKDKQDITVSFGQRKIIVPIHFHNGEELILSKKLAKKILFPFDSHELHVVLDKNEIKIGPIVGIYVHEASPGNFGKINTLLKDLATLGRKTGVVCYVFTPNQTHYAKEVVNGYINVDVFWNQVELPLPDIIFDRGVFVTSKDWKNAHLDREFLKTNPNILKFNAPIGSKYDTHKILLKNPMLSKNLPETIYYNSLEDIRNLLNKYPTVYLKPLNGTQGQGICRITKQNQKMIFKTNKFQYIADGLRSATNIINNKIITNKKRSYIAQQGIPLIKVNRGIVDFRVLIQKKANLRWGITSIIARTGKENDITSNLSNGGTVQNGEYLIKQIAKKIGFDAEYAIQQIKDVSILVAYTLETHNGSYGELGIDIGIDKNGHPWIIEINPRPGRKSLRIVDEKLRTKSLQIPLSYCLELWLAHSRGK